MKTRKVRTKNRSKSSSTASSKTYEFISGSDEVSEIVDSIQNYSWWIFGVPKIGKTSLAAQFPNARIAATETGHKSQRIIKEDLVGLPWPAYEEYLSFMQDTSKYETSVIDILEKAYDACFDWMKKELEIDGEPQWGEWATIRKPFIDWCKSLTQIPGKGCIFLSHASSREIEDSIGDKVSSIHPNLSGKTLTAIEGEVDILAYYCYVNNHRVLQIEGDDYVRAGNRLTDNFLQKGTTDKVKYIPMGSSPQEGYENILRAFENQQEAKHLYHVFPPKEKKSK